MKVLWLLALATTAAGASREYVENLCPPEQEENWEIEMLLRHPDCNKFYKCTFGQPVEQRCPADLYFNLDTWKCDWRENVDCTDRNVPSETTTPEPTTPTTTTTTTTTTPRPTTTTTTTTTPRPTTTTTTTTTPRPTTTTTTTTTPRPTTTTTTTTTPRPTTTTTSTTTPRPTTTTTTTTTPRPTTTTTTTTTPRPTTTTTTTTTTTPQPLPTPDPDFLENGCPVNPNIHWLLPHEVDCNLFYYCVWGRKVLRQCPSTLHFNRVIQVCDWPNRAGCPTSFNKHVETRRLLTREF